MGKAKNIVCWKWKFIPDPSRPKKTGSHFCADHVNKLSNMLRRHVDIDYRLICITDDPEGISKEVEIIPLWKELNDKPGCWRRLKIFSKEMKKLIGERIISIDLDCVILDNITDILEREEEFLIWGEHTRKAPYCCSFFMFDAGCRSFLWDEFDYNSFPRDRYRPLGTDQAWVNNKLYPKEKMITSEDGVYNFNALFPKRRRSRGKGFKYNLPANARLIFFNGRDDPSNKKIQSDCPWVQENWI